jgi:hypothetical protein
MQSKQRQAIQYDAEINEDWGHWRFGRLFRPFQQKNGAGHWPAPRAISHWLRFGPKWCRNQVKEHPMILQRIGLLQSSPMVSFGVPVRSPCSWSIPLDLKVGDEPRAH